MSDNLDDLLASMRGSALSAPAGAPGLSQPHRDEGGFDAGNYGGGGFDAGNYGGNLPSGESPARVPAPARAPAIPVQVYTVPQDEESQGDFTKWTAVSDRREPAAKRKPAPSLFEPSPTEGANGGKNLGVLRLPANLDVYARVCRSFVGRSSSVCVRMDCTIAHRAEGLAADLRPGDLLIVKSPGQTAHLKPRIASSKLDQGLLGDWLSSQETLENWTTLFARAAEAFAGSGGIKTTSAAEVEAIKWEEERAVRFRTPKKSRRSSEDLGGDLGLSPYSPNFQNGHEEFADQSDGDRVNRLVQAVLDLDHGLSSTAEYGVKLGADLAELRTEALVSARALETNVRLNKREIGDRPKDLSSDLDGVTVWGTITNLAEKMEGYRSTEHSTKVDALEASVARVTDRTVALENKLVRSVVTIREAMIGIQTKMPGVLPSPSHAPGQASGGRTLEARLGRAEQNISSMMADSKEATIKFNGLGLEGMSEANAWLENNMASSSIGYIVDPHTVMEHIHKEMTGADDFMKEFKRADDLQIPDSQFALAMTSFGSPIPKVFSKGSQLVVKNDASYFDLVPNWETWDFPETGKRQALRNALVEFGGSHQINIGNELEADSRAYQVAVAALLSSVSFLESLIQFIDDYVKHLTLAKFSHKRAFHVTTRLAKRILSEVYKPRQGVAKTFKTGVKGIDVIAQKIFWSSLQSLDIAMEIRRVGMMESQLVASELVKFLAVNTGIDAIEKLQSKVDQFEKTIKEAEKAAHGAAASAKTTSNQMVDKFSAQAALIDSLQRRVKAIEAKK